MDGRRFGAGGAASYAAIADVNEGGSVVNLQEGAWGGWSRIRKEDGWSCAGRYARGECEKRPWQDVAGLGRLPALVPVVSPIRVGFMSLY